MTTIDTASVSAPVAAARPALRGPSWAGIIFAPTFVVGVILAATAPTNGSSDAEWIRWYGERSNQIVIVVGGFLLVAAALLFLGFAAGLQTRLEGSREASPTLHRLLGSLAAVFAALVMVSVFAFVGIAGNILFGSQPVPTNADVLRVGGIGMLLMPGCITLAAFVGTAALLARRANLFGGVMVGFSAVAAVLLLGGVTFFPLLLVPIWVLAASIRLLRSR